MPRPGRGGTLDHAQRPRSESPANRSCGASSVLTLLLALAPAAREALPHLEALAADPRWPEDVRRLAAVAALRLAKD